MTTLAIPRPPAWLSPGAKREWKRVAPILTNDRRTLDLSDLSAFTAYCAAVDQVEQASREITARGYTYEALVSGLRKANPAVAIRDKAMTQVRLLAAELGMTSASRARAQTRADGDDHGLFD